MKFIVPPSVLKQKAKQLKKEKSLKHSQSLDDAAKEFGFSNYKNYLNVLEDHQKQSKPSLENLLKNISSENDMPKKIDLAISFIRNFKPPFRDQLNILKLFQHADDSKAMQSVCEKLNLMRDEIQLHLLNNFKTEEGITEIQFRHSHFIPKEISLSNLIYEIDDDTLHIEGDYNLKTEFEFEIDENDPISKDERFNDRELFGSFEITIDENKNVTIENSDIMENSGNGFFGGSFR